MVRATLRRFLIVLLVAALLGASSSLFCWDHAYAGVNVSITRNFQSLCADSWLNENSKNTNFGTGEYIEVASSNKQERGILLFDISQIPSGSTGITAILSLYISYKGATWTGATTRDYGAHQVTSDWVEADVTWSRRIGNTAWGTTGGDFDATATATDSTTGTGTGVWLSWTVTADVSDFISGTASNYGWIIKDTVEDSATDEDIRFHSFDYTGDTALRPMLEVTWTAPWDSHTDALREEPPEGTFAWPDQIVYMKGTTFATGTYNTGYYDGTITGGGDLVAIDEPLSVVGDGILNSLYDLTTDPLRVAGTWHALVQPASGYTGFGVTTYDEVIAAPDTYGLLANDSFDVQESAIVPEFPTVMASIVVVGLCFGIYYWMRKKLAYVKA